MDANDSTEVEIFGQTYNVRGEGDPNYLAELARFVDSITFYPERAADEDKELPLPK